MNATQRLVSFDNLLSFVNTIEYKIVNCLVYFSQFILNFQFWLLLNQR